jgi:hypothetical protein
MSPQSPSTSAGGLDECSGPCPPDGEIDVSVVFLVTNNAAVDLARRGQQTFNGAVIPV